MRFIVSGITLLTEYLKKLENNPELFRPPTCLNCGKSGLWCHGQYNRKADYERSGEHSLNPIPVFRFYCPNCFQTCSALPECIPPRRHYPWLIQQSVMLLLISGMSCQKISKEQKPSRWTISRWFNKWQLQFLKHSSHLRSLLPALGKAIDFNPFWKSVIDIMDLSGAMCCLNSAGFIIP